jgi:penicillin-binding protein 1A
MDFMKGALKGKARIDFKAPEDARFALVAGRREAFRPGTEPKPRPAVLDTGPVPYLQAFPDGQLSGAPSAAAAAAQSSGPAPPPPELNGLF